MKLGISIVETQLNYILSPMGNTNAPNWVVVLHLEKFLK
jgi:hypothetical protein